MESDELVVTTTDLGRVSVSSEAISEIVGSAAAESYGVVALAGRGRLSRLVPWGITKGIDVEQREAGLAIVLRIVVEHGLKLAEVASAVRTRIRYEIERVVGIPVDALEVHIGRVRSR